MAGSTARNLRLVDRMKLCECGCGKPAPIAKQTASRLGHVKGQPVRFVHGHHARNPLTFTVDQETGCWIFDGAKDPYGRFMRDGQQYLAHRYFYELRYGSIPEGLQLDHLCRTPACVNPDHLEAVTLTENLRRGEGTKLTATAAAEIRASTETGRALAKRFGVSEQSVSAIRHGRSWREVEAA